MAVGDKQAASQTAPPKLEAEIQAEELGGTEAIIDPGEGYPQVTGEPSEQAKLGTPLDPDGHERVVSDFGRDKEAVDAARGAATPIHLDDPEQAAEVNKAALEKGEAAVEKASGTEGGKDKAVRGPKESEK